MNFTEIISQQRDFFASHQTKDIAFRKQQLRKLKGILKANEEALYSAIYKDFKKSKFDTYSTEISFLYSEIDFFLKNLDKLSKPKRVATNLANLWGTSRLHKEPLGVCLIVGAWNYPYQLTLLPMITAMAAGNTCIVKPSDLATHSSSAIAKVINENFPSEYLKVVETDIAQTSELLKNRFDKIFFTGSTQVGKIYHQAAAKYLTPITLELGGKSPAIVTKNANLKVAAKRIVWGKFINAGQTCIAPDYIYVEQSIKDKFLQNVFEYLETFDYKEESEHYTQIINERHFDRLVDLIDTSKIIYGGKTNKETKFIEPTIMDTITWSDKAMQEEIFGPVLPVLTFTDFSEVIKEIAKNEKPLAAYLFSDEKSEQQSFLQDISFGGGCINDTLMHISNTHLPFGGIGNSGMGNYHGTFGLDTFSHTKAVLKRATWGEPNIKYPPYSSDKLKWIKKLLG